MLKINRDKSYLYHIFYILFTIFDTIEEISQTFGLISTQHVNFLKKIPILIVISRSALAKNFQDRRSRRSCLFACLQQTMYTSSTTSTSRPVLGPSSSRSPNCSIAMVQPVPRAGAAGHITTHYHPPRQYNHYTR